MIEGRFFNKYYVTATYNTDDNKTFSVQFYVRIKKSGAVKINERVVNQWKKEMKEMLEKEKNITISEVVIDTFTQVY